MPEARPAAAPVKSGTNRYLVTFADGKRSAVTDMTGEPAEQAIAGIKSIFKDGYVVAVELMNA